jgi:hypothetical protein
VALVELVRNAEVACVLALLEQVPAAPALAFLLTRDCPVESSEAARDLVVVGEELLPGSTSLLKLSGLGTQPLPLGLEARGVRLAGVLPSGGVRCFWISDATSVSMTISGKRGSANRGVPRLPEVCQERVELLVRAPYVGGQLRRIGDRFRMLAAGELSQCQ